MLIVLPRVTPLRKLTANHLAADEVLDKLIHLCSEHGKLYQAVLGLAVAVRNEQRRLCENNSGESCGYMIHCIDIVGGCISYAAPLQANPAALICSIRSEGIRHRSTQMIHCIG